ncbi:MAG: DNA primase [Spirochaetia bacterium]
MAIPEHIIKRIQDEIDIVDLIGRHVQLERRGDRYWGCCPFHLEKTPSFSVSASKNSFYCFGCKKSGGVFQFLMELEKYTFVESVEVLAHQLGITIEQDASLEKGENQDKKALAILYQRILKTFQHYLWQTQAGEPALQYLQKRGLSEATIRTFGLGYLPNNQDLHQFLTKRGYSRDLLKRSGLFSRNYEKYSLFSGRVLFPLFHSTGEVIAFSGRALQYDPQGRSPKYLNSPDTAIYQKKKHLYGFFQAKKHLENGFFLCEGAMDVCAMYELGYQGAIASLGTSLTAEQVKVLRRYVEKGYIVYDNDEAGIRAKKSAIMLFEHVQMQVKVVNLSIEKDPGEILEKKKLKGLQESIENAKIPIDFLVDEAIKSHSDGAVGAFEVCRTIFPFVRTISSPVLQDHVLRRLASRVDLKEGVVFDEFKHFIEKGDLPIRMNERSAGSDEDLKNVKFYHFYGTVYELLKIFLDVPEAYGQYSQDLQSLWLDTHEAQQIADYLRSDPQRRDFVLWLSQQHHFAQDIKAYLAEPTHLEDSEWQDRIPSLLITLEIKRLEAECRNLGQMIRRAEERKDVQESIDDLMKEYVLVAKELQELKAGLKS